MSLVNSALSAVSTQISILSAGFVAIIRLAAAAIANLFGSGGTIQSRLTTALTSPAGQCLVFSVLRALAPNVLIQRKLTSVSLNNALSRFSAFCAFVLLSCKGSLRLAVACPHGVIQFEC